MSNSIYKRISLNLNICDLTSGKFRDFSIKSQREKNERHLFWTKTILNTLKHRVIGRIDILNRKILTRTLLMSPEVILGHERLPAVFRQ